MRTRQMCKTFPHGKQAAESDGTSRLVVDARVEELKNIRTEETEAFATKLLGPVKKFIRKTTTTRDQVRAMIRCLNKCIEDFNTSLGNEGFVVDVTVPIPEADDSEARYTDEHRRMALELLQYLKGHTLESYLTSLDPQVPYSRVVPYVSRPTTYCLDR
ncbi:PREDICTED: uncharacterized protein LOC104723078 isoform X2 [Camelina sativa]|uniref:Uncharacterized protein LOC104723078 isoform X2 n=1 Tax=Camelina sativa TaxID=90675 RepID=A0ABM0UDS2_CAMSA|nr:PREDICTED: uncharacterized protein LOC104723078 isoform X2 [Camelina sativa]